MMLEDKQFPISGDQNQHYRSEIMWVAGACDTVGLKWHVTHVVFVPITPNPSLIARKTSPIPTEKAPLEDVTIGLTTSKVMTNRESQRNHPGQKEPQEREDLYVMCYPRWVLRTENK